MNRLHLAQHEAQCLIEHAVLRMANRNNGAPSALTWLRAVDIFVCLLTIACSAQIALWLLDDRPDGLARIVVVFLLIALLAMFIVIEMEWRHIKRYRNKKRMILEDMVFRLSNSLLPIICIIAVTIIYYFLNDHPGPAKITTQIVFAALISIYVLKVIELKIAAIESRMVKTRSGALILEVDGLPDDYDDEEIGDRDLELFEAQIRTDLAAYFRCLEMITSNESTDNKKTPDNVVSIVK